MRASSFDVTGANRDYVNVEPGQSKTITLEGSGVIKHIWTTFLHQTSENYRSLQITFQFDENEPSIDMPIADFFALPDGNMRDVNSLPIQVSVTKEHPNQTVFGKKPYRGAMNCYWEMPFLRKCRITLTNHDTVTYGWYYHVDWEQYERMPEDILYFHATQMQEMTQTVGEAMGHGNTDFDQVHDRDTDNYIFLKADGYTGHYVGLSLMVDAGVDCDSSWWEGDEMIVLDGEPWPARIHGTGHEDYFGLAYGVRVVDCRPLYGVTHVEHYPSSKNMSGCFCMYRFHLESPIVFKNSIKCSLEHGHNNKTNAFYSSVAYWYGRKK